jgi:serine/threonine protein kinase
MAQKGESIANRYRLLEKLGAGALGEVWAARDDRTERELALKLLRPSWKVSEKTLENFFREAKAAAKIRHASILELIDVGQVDEGGDSVRFVAMELLEAEKLEELLDRVGKLPVGTVLRLGSELAWALHHAHEKSIIHERIEPANILLHRDVRGEIVPKLVDFGVARLVEELEVLPGNDHGALSPLQFLSPEQIHADVQLDGRADVFGLAALLHRCLVGSPPFDGNSADEILEAIEDGPKKLEPFEPPIDMKVVQLIHDGLQRNRKLRPTMRVFAERLDALRERIEPEWKAFGALVQIPDERTIEHISKLRPSRALGRVQLVKRAEPAGAVREEKAPLSPRADIRTEDEPPPSSRESLPSDMLEDAPPSVPAPEPLLQQKQSGPPPLPKPGLEDAPVISEIIREKMKSTAGSDPLSLDVLADLEKELLRHVSNKTPEAEPTPVAPPPDIGLFKSAPSIPPESSELLYKPAPDSERPPKVQVNDKDERKDDEKPKELSNRKDRVAKSTPSAAATAKTLPPKAREVEPEKKSNTIWIIGGLAALFLIAVIVMQKNDPANANTPEQPSAQPTPIAPPQPPPPTPTPTPSPATSPTAVEIPTVKDPVPTASVTASVTTPPPATTFTAPPTTTFTAPPSFPTTKPTVTAKPSATATTKPTNDPTFGVDNAGF